jgi:hypothetical protein
MERFTCMMPFDLDSIQSEFNEIGIAPEAYLRKGKPVLANWLKAGPMNWILLGPWWGFAQKLIGDAVDVSQWAGGDIPPDELAHYTNFEPVHLGLFMAMQSINRNGNSISMMNEPQSIVLADGRNALYSPEDGIIETD